MTNIAKATEVVEEARLKNPFPNLLSEFVYKRTYARWNGQRRENWTETIDRYIEFLKEECPTVPVKVFASIRENMISMQVMGSMRAFWSAGVPARRDHTCIYNCSSLTSRVVAFSVRSVWRFMASSSSSSESAICFPNSSRKEHMCVTLQAPGSGRSQRKSSASSSSVSKLRPSSRVGSQQRK